MPVVVAKMGMPAMANVNLPVALRFHLNAMKKLMEQLFQYREGNVVIVYFIQLVVPLVVLLMLMGNAMENVNIVIFQKVLLPGQVFLQDRFVIMIVYIMFLLLIFVIMVKIVMKVIVPQMNGILLAMVQVPAGLPALLHLPIRILNLSP